MAGRGTVNRQVQVGVETTPGTPVAANKLLPSMSITLSPEIDNKSYPSQGFKISTANKIIHFDGGAALSGPLNYSEIIYLLNTLVTGVITTPVGGTLSRKHKFSPTAIGTDAFKTLTIQEGDTTAAVQMAYSLLTDFGVTVNDSGADVTGTLIGYAPTNVTLTSSPTTIAQLPIGPREIDIYIDPTFGAIGTTKVSDALSYNFSIGNKQVKKRVLNTTYQSFKESIEAVPTLQAGFVTEHNLQSRNLFAGVTPSSNPVQYVRLKSTGPIIEGAIPYSLQLDVAAQVIDMNQQDVESVWGYEYVLNPVYDSSFGNKIFDIEVVNTITAL
jgi:hypothetical protein